MTYTLTEYFVRHYTLVLDNEEGSYNAATEAAQNIIIDHGCTLTEYTNMSAKTRADWFAAAIGDKVIDLIADYVDADVPDAGSSVGAMLVREILILGDSDIEYALGEHYLPDPSEMANLLDDDDDDDEDAGDGDGGADQEPEVAGA